MNILEKLLQKKQIEKIYKEHLMLEREKVRSLSDEVNSISSSSYPSGSPDNRNNRGDETDAFSFPVKWAITCKRMAKSSYLSPILEFYKALFKTFNYSIEIDGEHKDKTKILSFLESQFKRADGLSEFVVNAAYGMLIYGFFYFTPKLESVSGKRFSLHGIFEGIYDFKYFDPTYLYGFTFDEKDQDKIKSISIMSLDKQTSKDKNKTEKACYEEKHAEHIYKSSNVIELDTESMLMGYVTYSDIVGNPMGKPFLYDVYTLWQIMESMDNSFCKNLENIGEHSFNFISSKNELDDIEIKTVYKDIKKFIEGRGGIFVSKYGKLEKIDGIDGKKWNDIRDGIIAAIYKSKGADIKALGLTRGATKDLASFAQSDSVIIAKDIIDSCIRQINKTFMRSYFNVNFKEYITSGILEYPKIKADIPK